MTPRRPAFRAQEPDRLRGLGFFFTALGVSGLSLS